MPFRKIPRYLVLTAAYVGFLNLAYVGALVLRFEGDVPVRYWASYLRIAPLFTILSLLGYLAAGLFHGLWRYASTATLFQVLKGVSYSFLVLLAIMVIAPHALFSRSILFLVWALELLLLGGVRMAWRMSRDRMAGPMPRRATRALVIGADANGVHLIHEMRRRLLGQERLSPVGFLDDDSRLTGHLLEGVRVLGTIADLPRALVEQEAELVIVSNPQLPAKVVREVARFCGEAGVRVKTLPGLSDFNASRPTLAQIRDVQIEDLLGRTPVQLDLQDVTQLLRGRRVLVTGAGGSIGSELARQVAEFHPSELVLLDHAENGLYYVHNELSALHPELAIHPIVGNVQDEKGIDATFARHRPQVVFHAAAHKHVPLLELAPREAVLNNIAGTRILVDASDRHAVEKFVLISTDKAVNPSSVMGASKRVCEMIGQSRSQHSRTQFVAVRFGNVLGSEGSVIPLFRRQLERGGPLTVTHAEARRYFMTIPEAVRLVLQAGAMGRGGEVFLLDMGEQVRILDLARQLIRLAGLREGEDVEIVITGLRPGEKLLEELHSDLERTRMTRHERILTWELEARDEQELRAQVAALEELARSGSFEAIKAGLQRLVPEYREPLHTTLEATPADSAAPLVELPVSREAPSFSPPEDWTATARRGAEAVSAALLLVLTSPLWPALWLEARLQGKKSFLLHEERLGRSRRAARRRGLGADVPIDRRAIERRTLDLLGQPFATMRFRTDLGPLSRWLALRRWDTVPYLLNVLRHEMNLVGPAPETADETLQRVGLVPDYARRFSVPPGVTGLAQLSQEHGDDAETLVRRAHYDLYYVDNASWVLDVRTLARAIRLSFTARPRPAAQSGPGGRSRPVTSQAPPT
jgi:FlaA1/EpsC-like NDP-sugar epimerase/lipopolysaccharide/colanic/teichoic acid biosynthesis glycosyltransferase